jgi:hypothetical protein
VCCAPLQKLKEIGVTGVMVDVWWGVVEREPMQYDWRAYQELVEMVHNHDLRMQVGHTGTFVFSLYGFIQLQNPLHHNMHPHHCKLLHHYMHHTCTFVCSLTLVGQSPTSVRDVHQSPLLYGQS